MITKLFNENKRKYRIIGSRECWIIQEFINGIWDDLIDDNEKLVKTFVTKWEAESYLRMIKENKLFNEKFIRGYKFHDDYYEIFENPILEELMSIPDLKHLGMRAILDKKTDKIYCFHGDSLFHTDVISLLGLKIYNLIAIEINPDGSWDVTSSTDLKGMSDDNLEIAENSKTLARVCNMVRRIR